MFVLPKNIVKKVVLGEVHYGSLPFDEDNERAKGYKFEDQARVNLSLAENHIPMCCALNEPCKKEACLLFANKSGKIPNGWVCREFQLDFPTALFDSRFHIAFVGIEKVDLEATKERLEELGRDGARYICLGCKRVYARKSMQWYEDGHGGRDIEMCSCGSDLFDTLDSFIKKC